MELRYHACGHPVRVWSSCRRRDGSPAFFDGSTSWAERTITLCPRCGERLTLLNLHEHTLLAKATVDGWLRSWPAVRQELDRRISQASAHDSQLATDQAETILAEFDWSLRQLRQLVAQLDQPSEAQPELFEDELMLIPV